MEITKESKIEINLRDKYRQIGSKAFAIRLKLLREAAELTQVELAEKLGVSRGTISYYEKAERIADIDFLCKVAALFGVTYDYLLGESNSAIIEYADVADKLNFSDKAVDKIFELDDDVNYCFSRIIENDKFDKLIDSVDKFIHIDTINQFDDFSQFKAFCISKLFIEILLDVRSSVKGEEYIKQSGIQDSRELEKHIKKEIDDIKKQIDDFKLFEQTEEEEFERRLMESMEDSVSQKIFKYFSNQKGGADNGKHN